ncbi:ATP-dependent Clp protease proteolytic subunit [Candidatus Hodgkinia cicadicola]
MCLRNITTVCYLALSVLIWRNEIKICINSHGGDVIIGLSAYDIIQISSFDARSICLGRASSIASLLLISGTIGKRVCASHTSIFFHYPNVEVFECILNVTRHIFSALLTVDKLVKVYMKHCRKTYLEVGFTLAYTLCLNSVLALGWGVLDRVL